MKKCKQMLPYLLITAAATFSFPFLLLPFGMTGAMMLLFFFLPAVSGVCGFLLGKKDGIVWSFGPLCGVLFWLSLPVFYNSSALVYGLIYAGIALAGCCVGAGFKPESDAEASNTQDE